MRAAPANSNLPTFFRWCLGGMAAFASGSGSGSGSASARDADPAERVTRLLKEVELECGDIPSSQEDLLARAPFLPDALEVDPTERYMMKKVELDCGVISASQEDLLARAPFLDGMAAFASGSGSASARDSGPVERIMRMGKEMGLECGGISVSQYDLLARAGFLGGMATFASGSGHASARDEDPAERILRLGKEVELECGEISASQEDLLARAPFLGGGEEEEDAEVFSTPPLTQSQQDQGEEGDVITMCSLPFSQPPPSCPIVSSPEDNEDQSRPRKPQKPRVCIRKVRGAKIRTPTPSPPTPSPSLGPSPEKRSTSTSSTVDPLTMAVLMIPTPPPPGADEDILVLARRAGIF